VSPELRAVYRDMLEDLRSVDPAQEGLDPSAVSRVVADISLALTLDRTVPGCGQDHIAV
jgi:hypothetical protein